MNFDNREFVELECPECDAEFTVDINKHEVGMTYQCPQCREVLSGYEIDEIIRDLAVNEKADEVEELAMSIGVELIDAQVAVEDYHAYILEHVESNDELLDVLGELYNYAYSQGFKRASLSNAVEMMNLAVEIQDFEDERI